MKTKLTLTVDKSTIEKAKIYAEEQGRSLSALIENYLKALHPKNNVIAFKFDLSKAEPSSTLKRLIGSVKLPYNFDYKEERLQRLNEKYLSDNE